MKCPKFSKGGIQMESTKIRELKIQVYPGITWGKWGIMLVKQTHPEKKETEDANR